MCSGLQVVLVAQNGFGGGTDPGSQDLIVGTDGNVPTLTASLSLSGQVQESRFIQGDKKQPKCVEP
jgi:hypothetical protein